MGMSDFYRRLRERAGSSLLLIPAVAAIIRDESGRVLVHQTRDDSWSLPAGAIEPGETPAQAVVREVEEETGLLVAPVRVAAVVGGPACRKRYQNGDEVEYVVTCCGSRNPCRRFASRPATMAAIGLTELVERADLFDRSRP